MAKLRKMTAYMLILLFTVFTLVQVIPNAGADTQSGFILASAGKDGQFGTGDDIAATDTQKAVIKTPVNISTEAVASAGMVPKEENTEPRPLRQPNPDEIVIRTAEELAKIGVDPKYPLNGKYILMTNIDLSGYSNWVPIGSISSPFTGQFDGNGFIIKNLTINRPGSAFQGLFGRTNGPAVLLNIRLENVNVVGSNYTGALVGRSNFTTIINCSSTGSVVGNTFTGGLIGHNFESNLMYSFSTCNVTGKEYTGGLVGANAWRFIANCYAVGNVQGEQYTGGIVGLNVNGTVKNCYFAGNIKGISATGGVAGGTRGDKWASGSIIYAYIYNSFSLKLTPVGTQDSYSIVSNVYSKSATALKQQSTFVGWDFTNIWAIDEGKSYPYLRTNEQIPHPGTN